MVKYLAGIGSLTLICTVMAHVFEEMLHTCRSCTSCTPSIFFSRDSSWCQSILPGERNRDASQVDETKESSLIHHQILHGRSQTQIKYGQLLWRKNICNSHVRVCPRGAHLRFYEWAAWWNARLGWKTWACRVGRLSATRASSILPVRWGWLKRNLIAMTYWSSAKFRVIRRIIMHAIYVERVDYQASDSHSDTLNKIREHV